MVACVLAHFAVHHIILLSTFTTVSISDTRPNILLLFPDEWRFDWTDNYYIDDLNLITPTFSSIVSKGVRFVNAIVASPLCTPSRSCLASGKEYDFAGTPENMMDFPINQTTFYQLLQQNGYYTMITGKDDLTKKTGVGINGTYRANDLGFNTQRRCLDKTALTYAYPNITDPFQYYLSTQKGDLYHATDRCYKTCCNSSYPLYECPVSINVPATAYQDNWVTANSLYLLENKPKHQPWFMQVNFVGPHPPFFILDSMNRTVNNRSFPNAMNSTYDVDDMAIVRRDYAAEIENLDEQFQIIMDRIDAMNELNNTIICISSDHGEMLGDFSSWQKSKPWIASTNVPLVCAGADIVKNKIIHKYVTILDLAATFLDYAEVDTKTQLAANMTTRSLRNFLNGTWNDEYNEYRDYVSCGLQNFRLVVKQMNSSAIWKYICCKHQCPSRNFTNATVRGYTKLLFELNADPYEWNNVAQQYPDIVDEMQQLLPSGFCA